MDISLSSYGSLAIGQFYVKICKNLMIIFKKKDVILEKMVEKNTILGIFYDEERKSLCKIIKKGVPIPVEPLKKVSRSVEKHTKLSYIFIYKDKREKIEKKLDALDIKEFLKQRIKCPKHNEHKIKCENHRFKDIIAKGNSNRFYCKNHPDRPHNKYEFRFEVTEIYTLQKFLKEIEFYEVLYKIYSDCGKENKKYNIKKDEKELLKLFFYINLSTVIIAKLFCSSRPTITSLKKMELAKTSALEGSVWNKLKEVKVTSYKNVDPYKRLFNLRLKISQKHMKILLNFIKERKK